MTVSTCRSNSKGDLMDQPMPKPVPVSPTCTPIPISAPANSLRLVPNVLSFPSPAFDSEADATTQVRTILAASTRERTSWLTSEAK